MVTEFILVIRRAKHFPIQWRGSSPKGKYVNLEYECSLNLSGSNLLGSDQYCGFKWTQASGTLIPILPGITSWSLIAHVLLHSLFVSGVDANILSDSHNAMVMYSMFSATSYSWRGVRVPVIIFFNLLWILGLIANWYNSESLYDLNHWSYHLTVA